MSRNKGSPAIVTWSGDWRCSCGSTNKLWDGCVCGQASPCREWVRGNCSMPKCRFPHPPFKIPEHLPKPADPIANPPAAAAKQKAVAQAHAAALAAERNPLCKEMAIVTWLGHWQCNCGKVHKLWDACKCGQQPPCREWVRGQCDLPKCRFPHPPFAIPSNLPKPDDPIANPTPEQLAIPLQSDVPAGSKQQPKAPVNGKVESGSGGSTPMAVGGSSSAGSEAAAPNSAVYGAVGQPVPTANGHHAAKAEGPPPPPISVTKPGVSFRAALLKSSAAGEDAHGEHGESAYDGEQQAQQQQQSPRGQQAQAAPQQQEEPAAAAQAAQRQQQQQAVAEAEQAAVGQQQAAGSAEEEQAQQQQQPALSVSLEGQQGSLQNGGVLDPVVAAPASARSNAAAAAATAGSLGWNPMAQGGVFTPIGAPAAGEAEQGGSAGATGLAAAMGGLGLGGDGGAQQQAGSAQAAQATAAQQQAGGMQLPPPPAPVATHPQGAGQQGVAGGVGAPGPSPRVHAGQGMLPSQPGSAHMQAPAGMSPRLGMQQQQQQQQASLQGAVAAMSPRFLQQQQQQQQQVATAAASMSSPRFMSAGAAGARPLLGAPGSASGLGMSAKPSHLAAALQHGSGMGLAGAGLGAQQQAAAAQQQQQFSLQAALQQMALQQQAAAVQQQQQQHKPVHVIAKTLLEFGLMDPAFYHALRQVDFLPDGYYQQDTLTLEDQQRRMDLFNAAVDSYIAAGVDNRGMLEIACQAKIGLTGGPLYYRCANCAQPIPTEMRQRWCAVCKVTPFCSPECHHRLYHQHRGVCSSMLTKPLLPSQIALRIALEIYNVHGLTGAALHQAILRQTGAVQRSYAAAIAAAAAAGVVDE